MNVDWVLRRKIINQPLLLLSVSLLTIFYVQPLRPYCLPRSNKKESF